MLLYPYDNPGGLLGGGDPRAPNVHVDLSLLNHHAGYNPFPAGAAAVAAPPAGSARPNLLRRIGSGLGQLFGGPDDPSLPPEQNAAARRFALMQAGLTTIAAGGSGASSLQSLAAGALQGQATGGQMRTQQSKQDLKARMMEELQSNPGGVDLPMLRRMFVEAVARGDTDAQAGLSEIIKTMEAAASREPPRLMEVRGADGSTHLVNPATGEDVRTIQGDTELQSADLGDRIVWYPKGHPERIVSIQRKEAAPGNGSLSAPQPYTDPVTGKTTLMAWDSRKGQLVPVGGALPPTPAVSGEDARKAAGFLAMLPRSLSFIDNFAGTPSRVAEAATDRGLREFTGSQQQQLNLAGKLMAEAWLRMTTGAAYTTTELANAQALFIPQPGDRAETLAMKAENRQGLMAMLRARAGVTGAPAGATAPGGGGGGTGGTGGGSTAINRSLDALTSDTRSAVERMVADARAAGHDLRIRETGRTRDRQAELFAQGPDTTRTMNSRHLVGEAADFDGDAAAMAWMRTNASRYGLRTIGAWDPGHVEWAGGATGGRPRSLLESMGGLQLPGAQPAATTPPPARRTVMGLDPNLFIHNGGH